MELSVTVHVDLELQLSVTKSVPQGSTVAAIKEALARDDPTGQARAQDFVLAPLRQGSDEASPALDDAAVVTEEVAELVVYTAPPSDLAVPTEVVEYRVLQHASVKKLSTDPASTKIVKLSRRVGSIVFTTGRTWTGPRGGEWVELDSVVEKPGWLLVEGPGFGIPGPLLRRVEPGESPPMVLRVAKPKNIGPNEEVDMRSIVVQHGAQVREAKEWIALIFGLGNPRHIIIARPGERRARARASGNMVHIKSIDGLLEDGMILSEEGFEDGDEVLYSYTGDLDKCYEGKEPTWAGKLSNQKAKAVPELEQKYPELRTHFQVLDLAESAAPDAIKRHYRRLALECHPDKHPDDVEAATQRFQEVKAAYEAIRERLQI